LGLLKEKFTDEVVKKLLAIVILILLFIVLKPFKDMLLLTVIFVYFLNMAENFIYKKVGAKLKIGKQVIAIILFALLVGLFVTFLFVYLPKLSNEFMEIKKEVTDFLSVKNNMIYVQEISNRLRSLNYMSYIKDNSGAVIYALEKAQGITVSLVMSLLLTFFCVIEEKAITEVGEKLSRSKLSFFYNYYKGLAKTFMNSFGVVLQIQFILAFINGVVAFIVLLIMGFPQALALGLMLFILSLVPVIGTTIASVPLIIIAFKLGGISKIVGVIILIAVLHILENYVIKPKLMSSSIHLPIFIIFLSLIIGEHLMGIWGLLLSIPILTFFMEVFEVK